MKAAPPTATTASATTQTTPAAALPAFDGKAFVRDLPQRPGVYRMLGEGGEVLYIGKAKNLKKRVASYFRSRQPSPRIALMVARISAVEITVTHSEAEALLLENNLIKTLAPRYNILFRDDKSYPYICFTQHDFARLVYHRGAFARGAQYFGPYPNVGAVRESIDLIQKTFRLRTCEDGVFKHRSRPCLLHQIKRCTAPCTGEISLEDYRREATLAMQFLQGRTHDVINDLQAQMQQAAADLAFEQAAAIRDRIRALQTVLHQQFVESGKNEDVDVLVALSAGGESCVNLAMIRGGRHLGDRPQFARSRVKTDTDASAALLAFVDQHYRQHTLPGRIISNIAIEPVREALAEVSEQPCPVAAPRRMAEKAWIRMAEENARTALARQLQESSQSRTRLQALADLLQSSELPRRIECFDISHTQGEATVASCVVCLDGVMQSSEYRRYNITAITAGDDYAAMRQVLERRYGKLVAGQGVYPDLVVIDGGKGQLAAARAIVEELGANSLVMIGIAKAAGRKVGEERIVFDDGRAALAPGATHPALHLLIEIRDEAHRFAITGHRARRARARMHSRLEDIPGIGAARRRKLLASFGGLDGVRNATVEDLARTEGISHALATKIEAFFR